MDTITQTVYQSLEPLKQHFENQYRSPFDTFVLKEVFEGFPPAGFVLQVRAPWITGSYEWLRLIVMELH